MQNKHIKQLVNENYIYARALHYLGIEFLEYGDDTLIEACNKRNLSIEIVIRTLDSFTGYSRKKETTDLSTYPVSLIIGYLKHSHQVFIKDKLPYIHSLITKLDPEIYENNELQDLQIIFPVFLEDFIKHIYEEEDTLFGYIQDLDKFDVSKNTSVSNIFLRKDLETLEEISKEHEEEDEMRGLREMIDNISRLGIDDLVVNTIVKELVEFDKELDNHAIIENDILFPKAIALEKTVFEKLAELSKLN